MPPPSAPNKNDTSQVPAVSDAGVPYAWVVVALLVPVVLLNYLDRQMLATMRAAMVADLPDLTRKEDWGMALACFKWTYALMSPFGGMLADRVNKRHLIPLSLCAWSAVTWWTGHVTSFGELLLARAVMGASEAFYMPTALALIAEMHSPGNRSKAVGLHQTGLYLGQILGGFAGYAAESPSLGWRWAFDKAGVVGLLYAVPLIWILRKNQPRSTEASEPTDDGIDPQKAPFSNWLPLLRNRNFLLLAAYFTLPAIAAWVVRDWMPDILRERFGLGQGQAGVSAILYLQIASVAGAIGGGILADRWETHSVRGRLYASALGTLLFLPALFSVGNAPTLSIAIGGLLLFGLGWGAFDSNNMPILCQVVSPERRATAYGLMNMVSLLCGGVGDWLFGFLRDRHVSLQSIFSVFAGVALLSIGFVLLIRPDKRTAESRA
jgi:MFS transporter, Spinster family, sphingosine-1-phosphate transporter